MPYTMLAVSHSPLRGRGGGPCGSIKSFANRLRYIFAFFIQSPSASAAFVSCSTSMEMDSDVVDDEQHDDEDDEQDDDKFGRWWCSCWWCLAFSFALFCCLKLLNSSPLTVDKTNGKRQQQQTDRRTDRTVTTLAAPKKELVEVCSKIKYCIASRNSLATVREDWASSSSTSSSTDHTLGIWNDLCPLFDWTHKGMGRGKRGSRGSVDHVDGAYW